MTKIEQAEQWLSGKPPKLWKGGDVISGDELNRLAKFGSGKAAVLFDSQGGDARFGVTELTCHSCGKNFAHDGLNKTRLVAIVARLAMENRPYYADSITCPECVSRANQERDEAEKARRITEAEERQAATVRFIATALSPTHHWGEQTPRHKWFTALMGQLFGVDRERIETTIQEMPYAEFLQTPYWKAVAQQVRYRARFRCQLCDSTEELHVHHRNYAIHGREHEFLNDLICLCANCHYTHHENS